MNTKEFEEACKEINEIFKYLDKNEVNKIPYELREIFDRAQCKEYVPHIDPTKTLDKQDLKRKTKDLLVNLYVKYWCDDEDRKEIDKILNENYEKKQLELREKYNPDDIFKCKNKSKKHNVEKQLAIAEYKESILKKLINKINNLFKK